MGHKLHVSSWALEERQAPQMPTGQVSRGVGTSGGAAPQWLPPGPDLRHDSALQASVLCGGGQQRWQRQNILKCLKPENDGEYDFYVSRTF